MRLEQQLENYKNYVETMLEIATDVTPILTFDEFIESSLAENDEFIKSFGTAFERE